MYTHHTPYAPHTLHTPHNHYIPFKNCQTVLLIEQYTKLLMLLITPECMAHLIGMFEIFQNSTFNKVCRVGSHTKRAVFTRVGSIGRDFIILFTQCRL